MFTAPDRKSRHLLMGPRSGCGWTATASCGSSWPSSWLQELVVTADETSNTAAPV
jgi:hypothetical protein